MSVDVEGKSLVELLDMLEPAPVPDPISMVPQTWGWAVLAAMLASAAGVAVYQYIRYRRRNEYRRIALAELEDAGHDVAKIAGILRRAALAAYPRELVANLYGQEWVKFLKQTSVRSTFSDSDYDILLKAPYRVTAPSPGVSQLAEDWIKTHRPARRQR